MFPLLNADAINAKKNIVLDLDNIPNLLLNEREIRQLVINLTRNGLEAMEAGGNLKIRTYKDNTDVVLSVQDEGTGIQSDISNKLFTPFFTTKENGTGLGLAICYGIAMRHNATIEVDTNPNGSTFYVRFARANLQ